MKVTIKGNLDQVCSVLKKPRKRAERGMGTVAQRNRIIAAQHATLVKAFKLVRNEPADKQLADTFLAAIGDLSKRTAAVLKSAEQIIAERS